LCWRCSGAKPGFGGRTALRGRVRTAGRQLRELAEAQSLLARSGHGSRDSCRSASTQVPSRHGASFAGFAKIAQRAADAWIISSIRLFGSLNTISLRAPMSIGSAPTVKISPPAVFQAFVTALMFCTRS
jgi:hypothetical protein